MIMPSAQTDTNTTANQNNASSPEETNNAINDLESKAKEEQISAKRADNITITLVIGAGALGLLIGLVSLWSSRANSRLRSTENLLNNLQIAKVRADAEKQLKVETAKVIADADEKIAKEKTEAQEREAKIKADAEVKIAQAHAIGEQANEKAGKANQRAGELELQAQQLAQQNLATEARLETERKTRLELAQSLAPRVLPIIFTNGEYNFDPLKLFAGVNVEIEYLPADEPSRLALSLANVLRSAGWKVVSFTMRGDIRDPFRAGVIIEASPFWQRDLSTNAGEALIAFLHVHDIHASNFPGRTEGLASPLSPSTTPDRLRILVSFKPDLFVKQSEELFSRALSEQEANQMREMSEEYKRYNQMKGKESEQLWQQLRQAWRARRAKTPSQ